MALVLDRAAGGVPLIERWGSRLSIGHAQVQRVERYFEAHGAKTVFLATFVAGFKNLVPALAGASNMGFGRFFGYSAAVDIPLRGVALVGVGYLFGQNLPRALEVIGRANGWLLALIVSPLILLVVGAAHSGAPLAKKRQWRERPKSRRPWVAMISDTRQKLADLKGANWR